MTTDSQVDLASLEIYVIARTFVKPADAMSAMVLAEIKLYQDIYGLDRLSEALAALDEMKSLVKKILKEGWN